MKIQWRNHSVSLILRCLFVAGTVAADESEGEMKTPFPFPSAHPSVRVSVLRVAREEVMTSLRSVGADAWG